MPAPCRALRVALGPRPKRRTHYARGRYYDCVIHVAQSTRRVVSDACYRLRPYNDVATRSCLASSGGVTVRLVCVSCVGVVFEREGRTTWELLMYIIEQLRQKSWLSWRTISAQRFCSPAPAVFSPRAPRAVPDTGAARLHLPAAHALEDRLPGVHPGTLRGGK